MGREKEVVEAAWQGYDAWVRLANASMDDLYRNPVFGDLLARSLDRWLRWQRLSQAMTGAFFAALWPAMGLPTAAAVQALHEDLHSLDTRLKAQAAPGQTLRALDTHVKTQDAAVQALRAEMHALETLRQELRSKTADHSTQATQATQSPREQISIEPAERRAALPARRNGNGAVHNGTRAAVHKKLANGHAAKDRRRGDAVTA